MSVSEPRLIDVVNVEVSVQHEMENAGFKCAYYGSGIMCDSFTYSVPDGWIIKSIDDDDKYELYDPQNVLRFTLLKC